jgi:hypothetical protein
MGQLQDEGVLMDIFRTLIVDAANVALAREIAASFGPGGMAMWTTPLSPTGDEPATHYISSGYVPEEFANLLTDPVAVFEAATAQGVECTQDDVDALFAAADVTEQEPFTAMARLGVQIVNPAEELEP